MTLRRKGTFENENEGGENSATPEAQDVMANADKIEVISPRRPISKGKGKRPEKRKRKFKRCGVTVKQKQRLCDARKRMRAAETPEQREARLTQMRERAKQRIAGESAEEREARLAQLRLLAKARSKVKQKKREEERIAKLAAEYVKEREEAFRIAAAKDAARAAKKAAEAAAAAASSS